MKTLVELIKQQKDKENNTESEWHTSIYKDIRIIQSNNVGIIGEKLINNICNLIGNLNVDINGNKTKQIGGGIGDGYINNYSVEIKTAVRGLKNNSSFQHELGEHPWHAEYMIFIDIGPNDLYLTIFKNFKEDDYKNPEFKTIFINKNKTYKKITCRKKKGNFKLDLNIHNIQNSIIDGYTLLIKNDIDIYNFIVEKII